MHCNGKGLALSKVATSIDKAALGQRLLAVRNAHRLPQAAFAARLGLSPRAYQNYERGERELPAAVLTTLHAKFGIDPLWVLVGPGSTPRQVVPNEAALLEHVVVEVEKYLRATGKRLTPVKKARAVRFCYQKCVQTGHSDTTWLADLMFLIT